MFLRATCFFFLLFLKTKNLKNLDQKNKKKILREKKNGNDFGDENQRMFVCYIASYFTRGAGSTVGGWVGT